MQHTREEKLGAAAHASFFISTRLGHRMFPKGPLASYLCQRRNSCGSACDLVEVATGRYVQVQLHAEGSSPFCAGARLFSRRACAPELRATVLALEIVNGDFGHAP
eukprot:9289041-Heterocapsa_arctica.AAC.1